MNAKESSEMLRTNWFHILVALAQSELHGSAVARDVLEQTGGSLRLWPATLYRALEELTAQGFIEEVLDGGHPEGESSRLRYYRATATGRARLAEAASRMASFAGTAQDRLSKA